MYLNSYHVHKAEWLGFVTIIKGKMQLPDNIQLTQYVSIAVYCFTFVFLFNFIHNFSDIFLSFTTGKYLLLQSRKLTCSIFLWSTNSKTGNFMGYPEVYKGHSRFLRYLSVCHYIFMDYNRQWKKYPSPIVGLTKDVGTFQIGIVRVSWFWKFLICMLLFYFNGDGMFVGLGYLLTLYQLKKYVQWNEGGGSGEKLDLNSGVEID